jgi:RNA polymerase sigma factor (sigma-70 family)
MGEDQLGAVLHRLHRLTRAEEPSDAQLLERFTAGDEQAFELLVRRHGPMVLGVCRRVLRHAADADDAFQATFLVLMRRAATLHTPSLLGNWLYGVAYRTAAEARKRAVRTRGGEREAQDMAQPDPTAEAAWRELRGLLDEELSALPDKYRAPLVLCYLEGLTHREAAQALGISSGSMSTRLGRARELLRQRLTQRGVALSAAALAVALAAGDARALVPATLVETTVKVGHPGAVSPRASLLAERVLTTLPMSRGRLAVLLLLLGLAGAAAVAGSAPQAPAPRPPAEVAATREKSPGPATDLHGDPLPAGAVTRLGTVRLRNASTTLKFSPDGKVLAAAGDVTRLFDAASGKPLHRLAGPSSYLAFTPDSKTLLALHYGFMPDVVFWDVSTGKERRRFTLEGGSSLFAHGSADGKLLITRSWRQSKGDVVAIWDTATGKVLRRWADLSDRGGHQVAFTPDGKAFALHSREALQLFDSTTGKELRRFGSPIGTAGRTLQTPTFAFSADGSRVACLDAGNVSLWETATGRRLRRLKPPREEAFTVALAPDADYLAAGAGETVLLWDLKSGKLLHTFRDRTLNMPTYLLAFSPDGKTLAAGDHQIQAIRLWDVASGRERSATAPGTTRVEGVAFGPGGKTVVSSGAADPVCLWDATTGKLLRRFDSPRFLGFNGAFLAIPPVGKTLFTFLPGDASGWDLASGKKLYTLKETNWHQFSQCFPAGGRTLLVVYPGAEKPPEPPPPIPDLGRPRPPPPRVVAHWTRIGLFDVRSGDIKRSFQVDADFVRHLALSPDGRLVAGLGAAPEKQHTSHLFLWDLETGVEVRRMPLPHLDGWNGIAFSSDGRSLISGPHPVEPPGKGHFLFWEVATGKLRGKVDYPFVGRQAHLTVFAGDRLAAVALEGGPVCLVDPLTGKEPRRLVGHEGRVDCMAFSDDGRRLATGSQDTTVLVWDVAGLRGQVSKRRLSPQELADCWAVLASADAAQAYRAMRQLSRAPAQALALFRENLQPARGVSRKTIARLIGDLDSKSFPTREKAARELVRLDAVAEHALKERLARGPSLEVRRRVEAIQAQVRQRRLKPPPVPVGEPVRRLRAVEVLERLGTPEARRLLERLARGAAEARLTQEARASLERLK